MAEYIEREAAKGKKVYSTERHEYVIPVAELDWLPAADVLPVVHGKWKHGVCQVCFFDWSRVAPIAGVPKFCPNCGAVMKGAER